MAREDIEGSEEMKLSNNPYGDVFVVIKLRRNFRHRATSKHCLSPVSASLYYTICIFMSIS